MTTGFDRVTDQIGRVEKQLETGFRETRDEIRGVRSDLNTGLSKIDSSISKWLGIISVILAIFGIALTLAILFS